MKVMVVVAAGPMTSPGAAWRMRLQQRVSKLTPRWLLRNKTQPRLTGGAT